MCAQSMVAAPLHPPMSSSAAPLASPGSYAFPQHWGILNNHASTNKASSNAVGRLPPRTAHQGYDSYVDRWLADTTSQTRARSVPLGGPQLANASSITAVDSARLRDSYSHPSEYPPAQVPDLKSSCNRPHRSMSPESDIKQTTSHRYGTMDDSEEAQIATYLQIPHSINSSKGSLAEFAARITCLFWFEDPQTLVKVEDATSVPVTVPLPTEANPTIGFRKWVTTLISTTQVSQNVILLALLFIYRLKKITSNVRGKGGSEYRLLTVALMLGNKFLDDNTYTNKTWADVSGISVSEIHVMEVEFLSNMKYNLYTSAREWDQWHTLLGRFADYFERGLRAYSAIPTPMSMTTSHLNGQPALPFTPPSEQLSPPHIAAQRMNVPQRQLPNPLPVYNMATNVPQPAPRLTEELQSQEMRAAGARPISRKRSFDEPTLPPPYKQPRLTAPSPAETSSYYSYLTSISPPKPHVPRLSMPTSNLGLTSTTTPLYAPSYPTTVAPSNAQLTLPAPAAMPQEQLWQPSSKAPPSNAQSNGPTLQPLLNQGPPAFQPHTPSEPQDISPTNTNFALPQTAHSPSGYLMYRNSPYRPVRRVNTLLAPPPAMPTLHSPLQHMSQQPTYYQPLSKGPIEPRQGMVPYLTPRQFQMAPMDPSRQIPPPEFRQHPGLR